MKIILRNLGIGFIMAALCCLPMQAMSTLGALGVTSALTTLIAPIATKIAKEATDNLPNILKLLSREGRCKRTCGSLSRATCSTAVGTRYCKSRCQKMIKVGSGYTLKIRYADTWNIQKCLTLAIRKKKHAFKEENAKSIAIYGDDDFKLAIKIISQLAALDEFIILNGRVPETEGKSPEEVQKLVQQADEEKKRIDKNFQEYAQKNFGPQ